MSLMKRSIPAILIILISSAPLVYYQLGSLVYEQAAATNPDCSGHSKYNTPDKFSSHLWDEKLEEGLYHENDTIAKDETSMSHYWFNEWKNVTIDVPDEPITLSAWVMEANESRPWVIFAHGIRSCKANHEVLLPAAMLHQADFNVVLFDMRDHGESSVEDGLVSAGQREYRDVLAVWQWIQTSHDVPPQSIGAVGISLGAGAVAIAFDQEPDLQAIFLDSSFSSMDLIIQEELEFGGFPLFLKDASIFAGKLQSGDNLVKHEPLSAGVNIGNRSMFITQSNDDVRIKIHHGKSLCGAATSNVENDGYVECWFENSSIAHDDSGQAGVLSHITLMLTQPDLYEEKLVGFFEQSLSNTSSVD